MKQPSNYAAILIACGTLASVTFPASGSSEEDKINALAEQAILLNNALDDLSSRLEVIEILAGELGTFQSKYQPEAALRVTSKLSEELGEISDELNDLTDAWNEVSNEASVVLPVLREIFESDSTDPRVEQGSEAFKRLQAVSLAIDFGLRREITEIDNELRITTRSIEMRERSNQGSEPEAPAAEADYLQIVKVEPMYPRTPHPLGLAGHCDLEFTITPLGTTANVRVIECTNALFKKASVQAVLKFKYKPRLVNGTAIAVPGVRHRVTFEMDERGRQAIESGEPEAPAAEGDYLPIVKVAPEYPSRAQSQGLEGYCDLEFTVTPLGSTADVRVIECTNSLFEQASVQALLKFKYKPQVVNGTAIAVPELRHRMMFQME